LHCRRRLDPLVVDEVAQHARLAHFDASSDFAATPETVGRLVRIQAPDEAWGKEFSTTRRLNQRIRLPEASHAGKMHDVTGPSNDARTQLDDVFKAIIEELQQDGRRSYAAIGRAVGLSEAAVRQRVQRLLDTGTIQIVAVTDPLQLGFRREAMIGITVEGDIEPVADKLAEMSEVTYCVMTAGSFDVIIEVVCEDDDHLLDVINKQLRAIPGVRGTESFVYLRLRKQIYAWGTR
jgi:Lrp/AsnC family transcriptional regulator for asnA, asnC and gidA